jgi:hypothetical protein
MIAGVLTHDQVMCRLKERATIERVRLPDGELKIYFTDNTSWAVAPNMFDWLLSNGYIKQELSLTLTMHWYVITAKGIDYAKRK